MKNAGKVFEDDLRKCVPEYALYYRLPDSPQSFTLNDSLRFSRKNPFDFFMFDSRKHILYAIEAKSVRGKSISFERTMDDKAVIHYHQIEGLRYWGKFDGVRAGFIIEFRDLAKTVFLDIQQFLILEETIDKKSFTIDDLDRYGIPYFLIPQKLKRTKYTYDLDAFLSLN